ncbi:DUF4244 domain-containing protein [Arcanobacterium pinnipediorum]|uniref:DUF4244 domain-containing protein n=1 Tax=Arcanobacterium pinnipediorum TaxID=1503041 RepID=A0ABY5AGV4_9ACTO|nr:DUF4244 domain-containing protein [Arcanobacterium pinnipediorum]USR79312.1 DUF4244 domain-containing protein [Arcanobacterium pinnipediorum]
MKALSMLRKYRNSVESGMVSAEYAVGTIATTSIAGILIWIAQQDWFKELFIALFKFIFELFMS